MQWGVRRVPALGGVTRPFELELARGFAGVDGAEERVTGAMIVSCKAATRGAP